MEEKGCPNMATCPYKELTDDTTEDSWKFIYCYEDSINGYEACARYNHMIMMGEKPPKNLLPDGNYCETEEIAS